jgi:formylglycine-generating enzyme required for sulfatase activity
MVPWNMAQEFAQLLSQRTGERFRLPTEAEWEYACRAGSSSAYSFGAGVARDQAVFDRPFNLPAEPFAPGGRKARRAQPRVRPGMHTDVAGGHPANAFGLRDMHGNVWEWCQDVYDAGFYGVSPRHNPVTRSGGNSRVLRGGSWVARAAAP